MCYAQGRTCICDSAALLEPCQMLPFSTRLEVRNKAAEILGASGDATIAPVGPLTYK